MTNGILSFNNFYSHWMHKAKESNKVVDALSTVVTCQLQGELE